MRIIFKYNLYIPNYYRAFALKNQALLLKYFYGLPDRASTSAVRPGKLSCTFPIQKKEGTQMSQEPRYTGRRKLPISEEDFVVWLEQHKMSSDMFAELFPDEPPFHPNEFVEFETFHHCATDKSWRNIARFHADEDALLPLKYLLHAPESVEVGIRPRSAAQAMILDLLFAPVEEVAFIILAGEAGTGKTLLSMLAARCGIETHRYKKILICPAENQIGEAFGAVPGDETDKAVVRVRSAADAFRNIMLCLNPNDKDGLKKANGEFNRLLNDGVIELCHIKSMQGRNLEDYFIFYDEAHFFTVPQAKMLLTRVGDRSKMVLAGDPHQGEYASTNPWGTGLNYAIAAFAGKSDRIGYVYLEPEESSRSDVLRDMLVLMRDFDESRFSDLSEFESPFEPEPNTIEDLYVE